MKKIIKDILILCIITVICGGVLGYVYQITLSPIEKQAQQSQQDAYLEVMKEATSFKEINSKEINKLAMFTHAFNSHRKIFMIQADY